MESRCCCCCCFKSKDMPLSSNFTSLRKITDRAISYLLDPSQHNPSLVAYTRYQLPYKYKYHRPAFLELDDEATQASADHEIRPVMHPKRPLVMNTGYAEVINAGKTMHTNEDQSSFHSFVITVPVNRRDGTWTTEMCQIPCIYFAVFDGHAGSGASLTAHHQLHHHIKEKLTQISHMLVITAEEMSNRYLSTGLITSVDREKLTIGAIERAFLGLDEEIKQQKYDFRIDGGCTAVVAVFIQGKLYVANAGDSRAILCKDYKVELATQDHTPETERRRVQALAYFQPVLLCNEYTRYQFQHRCRAKDVGSWQLYRDHNMDGWALKLIDKNDIKPQVVSGEGKRARLLDTIGTTRGFGDHDLEVPYSANIKIKPFLLATPDVSVYPLESKIFSVNDVLVLATDGLWEKLSNERCVEIIREKFLIQQENEPRRYIVAAQSLVDEARGVLGERGWRMLNNENGSYDDISVFVIPLNSWKTALENILRIHREETHTGSSLSCIEEYENIPRQHKDGVKLATTSLSKSSPVLTPSSKTLASNIDDITQQSAAIHLGQLNMEKDKMNHDLDAINRCYDQVNIVDIPILNRSKHVGKASEKDDKTCENIVSASRNINEASPNAISENVFLATDENEKLIKDLRY